MLNRKLACGLIGCLLVACSCLSIGPSQFGMNKVRRGGLDWQTLGTDNVLVNFYGENAATADRALAMIERERERITTSLQVNPDRPYQIFLYTAAGDYSGTNITEGLVEGSAGFTEFYKNRVALYGTGSAKRLRRVAVHEFVHAVSLTELLRSRYRSLQLLITAAIVPDWYMEGIAEYYSDDFDTYAEMQLRDCVAHNQLLRIEELRGFAALPSQQVGIAYKTAYTFIDYLVNRYGPEIPAKLLREFKYEPNWNDALLYTTGVAGTLVADEWHRDTTAKYTLQLQGRADEAAMESPKPLWSDALYPCASDSGLYVIADLASGNGDYDIYRFEDQELRRVTKNAEVAAAGLDVNRDGSKILTVTLRNNRPRLTVVSQHGAQKHYRIDELETFTHPRFIDEQQVALIGQKRGYDDVYIYDLQSRQLTQVTANPEAEFEPWVSTDGSLIVFSREYAEQRDLVTVDLATGVERRLTDTAWDERSPALSDDGLTLFYVADKPDCQGVKVFDIYQGPMTNLTNVQVLTKVQGGCFWPWPSQDGALIFSQYQQGTFSLAKLRLEAQQ